MNPPMESRHWWRWWLRTLRLQGRGGRVEMEEHAEQQHKQTQGRDSHMCIRAAAR